MWSFNLNDSSNNETVKEAAIAGPKLTCVENEQEKYCVYDQYRMVVKLVEGEQEGRTSYTVLEKKVGATYQAIEPSELFILNRAELIRTIDKKIAKTYYYVKNQFTDNECISALSVQDDYALDDFSISFREDGIFFAFLTGCKVLQGKGFTLEWEEIKPFIK